MPSELENLYYFFILDLKDIKDKQLTIIDHINLYEMYVYAAIDHINLYGRYVTLVCFKYIHTIKDFFYTRSKIIFLQRM